MVIATIVLLEPTRGSAEDSTAVFRASSDAANEACTGNRLLQATSVVGRGKLAAKFAARICA